MIKALDIKVEGLTSTQLHLIIDGIQSMLSYPDETSFIANNPKTEYTLLSNRVSANNPIYKDDKTDTLYVLIGERSKKAFAIMSKGRLINTSIHTNKKLFAAIVENSDEALQWLVIKNPEYKQMRAARYAARKDSEAYEREKDKVDNNSLIKQHLKTLETKLKDSEFEHDNFLLIARRAAVEWKKGNEDFFNKIADEYGEVSYSASETFKYLKNIYVKKLGETRPKSTEEKHAELTKKYAGWPWNPDDKYSYEDRVSITDKSGYRTDLKKYLWKRVYTTIIDQNGVVLERLQKEYNSLIENDLKMAIDKYIISESWQELKDLIDKIKILKDKSKIIDAEYIKLTAETEDRDKKYHARSIAKEITGMIDALKLVKAEIEKRNQGASS